MCTLTKNTGRVLFRLVRVETGAIECTGFLTISDSSVWVSAVALTNLRDSRDGNSLTASLGVGVGGCGWLALLINSSRNAMCSSKVVEYAHNLCLELFFLLDRCRHFIVQF